VVKRDSTQPAGDNWTEAIGESTGRYVKLMCADDLIRPEAVARQVADIEAAPGALMAASRRSIIDAEGRVLKATHGLGSLRGNVDGIAAIRDCLLAGTNTLGEPAAVLFDGEAIRAAMPWLADWPYMIDVATYAKVLKHGSVMCEPEVMASFRVSASSWSSSLLDQQPTQFLGWREAVVAAGDVPFSGLDRLRSDSSLRVRTFARRVYFARAARRERAGA
jgi:hypothetical protein